MLAKLIEEGRTKLNNTVDEVIMYHDSCLTMIGDGTKVNEGIEKYGLEPCYEIHKDTLDYKGYVHIQIPKGEDILYPWGIENVGIREQEQGVYISMKAGEISLQHSISFNLDQLIPFIKEGTIENIDGLFIVRSAYRKTNLELPIEMLEKVKQLAEQENITMSQWVEQAIREVLNMEES